MTDALTRETHPVSTPMHSLLGWAVGAAMIAALCLGGPALAAGADAGADSGADSEDRADPPPAMAAAAVAPGLRVSTVVGGLETPWDVAEAAPGVLLVTERDLARLSVVRDGERRTVRMDRERFWVGSETGLMSIAVQPGSNGRTLYTCAGWRSRGVTDIRVHRWRLDSEWRRATLERTVLKGLPVSTGRHGGCRIRIDTEDGLLWVGTGDAARSGVSRNLDSLGGKVLRVTRDGAPAASNPWADSTAPRRFVMTFGHRNVQGLAQRPSDGSMWSVEQGSHRDDEVNLLRAGGDYGWDPGAGYDESVPMTDQSLPGTQVAAKWSSGPSTIATSGADWVAGSDWGGLDGSLAVAALKGSRITFMSFSPAGKLLRTVAPAALRQYGRLRSVTRTSSGDLLVTTANGIDDSVLRVSPAG